MIGFLRGKLIDKEAPYLIVEAGGVGYELQVALSSFDKLPQLGKEVALYIHQSKRDDGDFLYGFVSKKERLLFRSLIKISSIGPKIALAILSVMTPELFISHLVDGDAEALERVPGIGAKTAKRVLIEMKDKFSDWDGIETAGGAVPNSAIRDAVSALVSLGYKQHEAAAALKEHRDSSLSSEELIRVALRKIK